MIEGFPIDRKIVHEDFHDFLDHVRENRHHTPLERSGCVTETKRHSSIGVHSIRAGKGGLALIVGVDGNLMIPRIPINETKERVLCQQV